MNSASPSVESDRVKSTSAPNVSAAMEMKNDQVECIRSRNHMRMNVCDRYTSLAALCLVFGIDKQASKQERKARKQEQASYEYERSISDLKSLLFLSF